MFISRLNWDLSLLAKINRMELETMSTPDLVNLANQLSHILKRSANRKTTRIVNLQLLQIEAHKQNQNAPIFYYYCKGPRLWRSDCYKFKCFRHLQFSNQPFQHLPNSPWKSSEELQGHSPVIFPTQLGETLLQTGDESLPVLIDPGATLEMLKPTTIKEPLP